MGNFKYLCVDFLFTCLGLVFLLLDIVLDILAAVSFYQEKAYVCLSMLVLFLVVSSVLVQAFSWLWYSYEDFQRWTKVEKYLSLTQLKLLHVLQLGIYFRHAGVVEVSVQSLTLKPSSSEGLAVFLSHDLSMLRLIETFSESAPQLVLMLTIFLQQGQLDVVTVLKAIGSASAIAFTVTTYHRSLRSFLPDKEKQEISSSVVYFIWNLLLISSRLTALALFASVLPCFIFTHFFCSWLVLFFFAWQAKTDFMDSPLGEWLYRATIGLIWYFHWFNVVDGRTRDRTLLYHGYILLDICFLCGLWCWKIRTEMTEFYVIGLAVSVVVVYILGLLFKILYYRCYHPNLSKEQLKGGTPEQAFAADETDFPFIVAIIMNGDTDISDRSLPSPPAPDIKLNKRMRKLAENFYS